MKVIRLLKDIRIFGKLFKKYSLNFAIKDESGNYLMYIDSRFYLMLLDSSYEVINKEIEMEVL